MSLILQGSTSGSITLQEPAVAGSTVLDLPNVSGTILTTGSSGQSIPKAALPTGSVLQVVSGTIETIVDTTSASFVTTGLTASITPTSSSSKVLVFVAAGFETQATGRQIGVTIYRNSTEITTSTNGLGFACLYTSAGGNMQLTTSYCHLDSPATTSSTSYTLYFKSSVGGNVRFAVNNVRNSIILMEIAA